MCRAIDDAVDHNGEGPADHRPRPSSHIRDANKSGVHCARRAAVARASQRRDYNDDLRARVAVDAAGRRRSTRSAVASALKPRGNVPSTAIPRDLWTRSAERCTLGFSTRSCFLSGAGLRRRTRRLCDWQIVECTVPPALESRRSGGRNFIEITERLYGVSHV